MSVYSNAYRDISRPVTTLLRRVNLVVIKDYDKDEYKVLGYDEPEP